VAVFLSTEWLGALDDAARAMGAIEGAEGGEPLVLEQEVRDAPDGVVRYQMTFAGARLTVEPAPTRTADLTFVCDHATAVALARGETNAQAALMEGRLRIRGDVERLATARDALAAMGDAFARVRATTEF
jgi:predicted lipid carrier protein YhbT